MPARICWGRGQGTVSALQQVCGVYKLFPLLPCTPLLLLQHVTNTERIQVGDRAFLVTRHVKLNLELFLCRLVLPGKRILSEYMIGFWTATSILPRLYWTSFRIAEVGKIGSQASNLLQVGEWHCHLQVTVQDEHEITPRLGGGRVHTDSAFLPPSSSRYCPQRGQAGTCIGQWQLPYC